MKKNNVSEDAKEKIFLPYWAETTTKLIARWETDHKNDIDLQAYLSEIAKTILGEKYEKIKKGGKRKCQQS